MCIKSPFTAAHCGLWILDTQRRKYMWMVVKIMIPFWVPYYIIQHLGCQNYDPFLGALLKFGTEYLGYPERDRSFDNHPDGLGAWGFKSQARDEVAFQTPL